MLLHISYSSQVPCRFSLFVSSTQLDLKITQNCDAFKAQRFHRTVHASKSQVLKVLWIEKHFSIDSKTDGNYFTFNMQCFKFQDKKSKRFEKAAARNERHVLFVDWLNKTLCELQFSMLIFHNAHKLQSLERHTIDSLAVSFRPISCECFSTAFSMSRGIKSSINAEWKVERD